MLLCAWNIIIIICNSALGKKIMEIVKILNSIIIFLLYQWFEPGSWFSLFGRSEWFDDQLKNHASYILFCKILLSLAPCFPIIRVNFFFKIPTYLYGFSNKLHGISYCKIVKSTKFLTESVPAACRSIKTGQVCNLW